MKKVTVLHCLGTLNTGGAETLVMNIFRKIDRDVLQFDFLLFNEEKGFYDQEAIDLGANLYYCPSLSKAGLITYVNYLVNFFKNTDIDVVHSHMDWQGGFIAYAAYKAGIKQIIVHSHANQKIFDKNLSHHYFILLNKYLISKYATKCLACSQEAGDSLFNCQFEVMLNGIDLDKFIKPNAKKIIQLRERFNIPYNKIILGTVGGLSENKNQVFLLDLLYELKKINPNYLLIIVGTGNKNQELKKKANDLGLFNDIIFTGVLADIPEVMGIFDIFLLPSKREGLGIVAIEAQTSGLPCIISDTVPKQVDMGLNLTTFVELDIKKWANEILNLNKEKAVVDYDHLMKSEYNIYNLSNRLYKIYTNNGE